MEKAANERQEKNQKVLQFDNPMMFNFCVVVLLNGQGFEIRKHMHFYFISFDIMKFCKHHG